MRTHRHDSVHVLAVTRADVLKVALDGRYPDQGKGKKESFPFLSRYISELLSRHGQEIAIVSALVIAQSSLSLVRVAIKLNL